jgi:thymidylate kinase
LWLDLPLAVALARRGHNRDRIEDKGSAFQQSVANGYARYAQLDPAVRRIDAELASEQVHAAVLAEVQVVLP